MPEYPPYPYQEKKLYKRLKEAFPVSGITEHITNKLKQENLTQYNDFIIDVEVKNLGKTEDEARRDVILYERYVEEGFPDLWVKRQDTEPQYLGFQVRPINRYPVYTDYQYKLRIEPSGSSVVDDKRRMILYSRRYVLTLKIIKDRYDWLSKFINAFLYCPQIHELDFISIQTKALDQFGKEKSLAEPAQATKAPFRMPIMESIDYLFKLKKFFSYKPILEFLAEQMRDRYCFAWKLAPIGDPIPRRHEIDFETPEGILKAFEEERCVEFYRSSDRRSSGLVDLLILEYDPPLLTENKSDLWKKIVEDERKDLEMLFSYGVNPNSIEENYSGHKSLQRITHLNPPISHTEQRDFQKFLAALHKFSVAKDSYMYTLYKFGLSRVAKTFVDDSYGKKKEIKTVPTPNIKRKDVHCSVPIFFSYENGAVRFADSAYNWDAVSERSSEFENLVNRFIKDEGLALVERTFKPQYFFKENATDPEVFRKMMRENEWLVRAVREVDPSILDLYREEWVKEKFA